MFFSQLITWFIIAAAGQAAGIYGSQAVINFDQASLVLRPLLGQFAFLIFALGIIGAGLLAIPVLAGSVGYILARHSTGKRG